jgi:putative acetyltransferase
MDCVIGVDDPRADDVRALLERHLAFSREVTPFGHVHALDTDGLLDPAVTFFSARRDGVLLGVGALRQLDESHAELKSMHTKETVRGQGIGRAMVEHLLGVAAERGYQRVSLETGTMDGFAPARSLYEKAGFVPCPPFANYTDNPHSACMTIAVTERHSPGAR